jgi:hypothetical protein
MIPIPRIILIGLIVTVKEGYTRKIVYHGGKQQSFAPGADGLGAGEDWG